MATRSVTYIVLDCDVTGCLASLEDGDLVIRFHSHNVAVQAGLDAGWTDLGGGQLACTRDNEAHDKARGQRAA